MKPLIVDICFYSKDFDERRSISMSNSEILKSSPLNWGKIRQIYSRNYILFVIFTLVQWNLPNPTLVRVRKIVRLEMLNV